MKKLIVTVFMTMDGVIQGPGGPEEDPTDGFPWGGWIVPFSDPVMDEAMVVLPPGLTIYCSAAVPTKYSRHTGPTRLKTQCLSYSTALKNT